MRSMASTRSRSTSAGRAWGHLFQSRFGNRWVRDELALMRVVAYITGNPVAAGLCDQPGEWEWSSHGATVDGVADHVVDVARLGRHIAPDGDLADVYSGLIEERLSGALRERG